MLKVISETMADIQPGARVVVAMSGGVDSSAVAALAVDHGFDVLGVTLQLYDHGAMLGKKGACCAGRDIHDARRVCDALGIPHYVLDYEHIFRREVIEPFAASYVNGETPIPCIQCNQKVKFRDLLDTVKDLGAHALLTGHYVQRFHRDGTPELHQAVDARRDQSYFLFGTTPEQLMFCRFPLGGVPDKAFTRQVAASHRLPVAQKPDSQDICFVVDPSYQDTLRKIRPDAAHHGQIVHKDGRILGQHEGIAHYTVGQRKGLSIAWHEPLYVIELDVARNCVIVGPRAALACMHVHVRDLTWTTANIDLTSPLHIKVKLRSTHTPVPADVIVQGTQAIVTLHAPEYGISPGQACVFYHDTQILGGGWILRAPPDQLMQ